MVANFLEVVHGPLGVPKSGFFAVSDLCEDRNINGVLPVSPSDSVCLFFFLVLCYFYSL